jgi:hypothetical protein
VTSDPTRLTVVGATDLERSLLQAARRERPSPELTARMAAGLGISVGAAVTVAAPIAAAAKTTTLTAWIPAGVVVVAVAAGVIGVRMASAPERSARASKPAAIAVAPRQDDQAPAIVAPSAPSVPDKRVEKSHKRAAVAVAPAGDLRDQIALIDAARTAVKAGLTERALVLLHRYDASYPGGAFRPEALALRVEALGQSGRGVEAKALARDFLVRYPQSPLADRVARAAK